MDVEAMTSGAEENGGNPLAALTSKQREVLDLLIQHKTSKEISRLLGISPHTVDQRILLARGKLGVATRNEVAQAYRRLKTIYEQPVYDFSHIDGDGEEAHDPVREVTMPAGEAVQTVATVKPRGRDRGDAGKVFGDGPGNGLRLGRRRDTAYHVLPEMFDGPYEPCFGLARSWRSHCS
jgi:DNA-binding CsgD family transcriptional regulator